MNTPPFWLRLLPVKLRQKIEQRHNLLKILGNTGWLFFDKVLRMGVGLIVGVWVARYLGPVQFGLFNYAIAIVALFTAIGTLGLNNIVVRDLVRQPSTEAPTTLGTAFLLQIVGGVLACLIAVAVVYLMRPADEEAILIVLILGITILFRASDVVRYWFEARVESKYTVWIENAVFILFAGVKIALILLEATLVSFVWLVLAEAVVVAILLIAVYLRQETEIAKWKYQFKRSKELLSDSWPLILSGLAVMLYMRIDQIMLGQMLGDEAVGIYSAAVRLSEIWYFIPMIIVSSTFPALIAARQTSTEKYEDMLKKLFRLMFLLALSLAIPISFMSEFIITTLYGTNYTGAASILVVHIWAGVFVFMGVASSRWFISENLQKYTFYRTLTGCVISLSLNYMFIPEFGPIGSAWSLVISQAAASVFFNAFNSRTRPVFYMQMQVLNPFAYKLKA